MFSGNESLSRELVMTGRYFNSEEALKLWLVSKICENNEDLLKSLIDTAKVIASKSPVAIYAIKKVMN